MADPLELLLQRLREKVEFADTGRTIWFEDLELDKAAKTGLIASGCVWLALYREHGNAYAGKSNQSVLLDIRTYSMLAKTMVFMKKKP